MRSLNHKSQFMVICWTDVVDGPIHIVSMAKDSFSQSVMAIDIWYYGF